MIGGGKETAQNYLVAQHKPSRLVRDRFEKRKRKSAELSGASIRSKQATEAFCRFDLGIHVRWSIGWHDYLAAQTLMIPFCVIMRDERTNGSSRRDPTEENQFMNPLGFQRPEKTLQVCAQIRASRWQPNRLHTLVA